MSGRSLSVFALVGSLATLVVVATMAGAGDAAPQHSPDQVAPAPVLETTTIPIQIPTSRAIHRFVRDQSRPSDAMLTRCES